MISSEETQILVEAILSGLGVSNPLEQSIGINNWYPLVPEKVIHCGKLNHFKTHEIGEEADWNILYLQINHLMKLLN